MHPAPFGQNWRDNPKEAHMVSIGNRCTRQQILSFGVLKMSGNAIYPTHMRISKSPSLMPYRWVPTFKQPN